MYTYNKKNTRCVKATRIAPSQKIEKAAISITRKQIQLKIWMHIENVSITDFQQFSKL